LKFDLIYPYFKGGIYDGWKSGCIWSQFWINRSDDIVCVNLYIGNCGRGEVRVFVLYCPSKFAKESLTFYRTLHPESDTTTTEINLPDYENFKIFPIPSLDYGLSEELIGYRNRILSNP
jgi:hypothetical protein